MTVAALFRALIHNAPKIAALLSSLPLTLTSDDERSWTPMDGASPPNCPFIDHSRIKGANAELALEVSMSLSCWNVNEVADCSVRFHATRARDGATVQVSVSAREPDVWTPIETFEASSSVAEAFEVLRAL